MKTAVKIGLLAGVLLSSAIAMDEDDFKYIESVSFEECIYTHTKLRALGYEDGINTNELSDDEISLVQISYYGDMGLRHVNMIEVIADRTSQKEMNIATTSGFMKCFEVIRLGNLKQSNARK